MTDATTTALLVLLLLVEGVLDSVGVVIVGVVKLLQWCGASVVVSARGVAAFVVCVSQNRITSTFKKLKN